MLQVSFDAYEVDEENPRIVKNYYLKDETNTILDDSLQYKRVNIAKSKDVWYDDTIKEQEEKDQKLIEFGGAMMMNIKKDFLASMESVKMSKKVKEEIKEAVIEYSEDPNSWLYYDVERDKRATYNAGISTARYSCP